MYRRTDQSVPIRALTMSDLTAYDSPTSNRGIIEGNTRSMTGSEHHKPVPNEGDQIKDRDRVVAKLMRAGVLPEEWEPLDDPVLVSQLYQIAVRRGCSAADFLPE